MEIQGSNPPQVSESSYAAAAAQDEIMADGWILFAGILLIFTGLWNMFEGFLGLFRSAYFIGHAVFGDLWVWALAWTLFGLLELGAGGAVLGGRSWGRWTGIVIVGLSTLVTMASLGTYPFWSLALLAIQFTALYALTVRWHQAATAY